MPQIPSRMVVNELIRSENHFRLSPMPGGNYSVAVDRHHDDAHDHYRYIIYRTSSPLGDFLSENKSGTDVINGRILRHNETYLLKISDKGVCKKELGQSESWQQAYHHAVNLLSPTLANVLQHWSCIKSHKYTRGAILDRVYQAGGKKNLNAGANYTLTAGGSVWRN